MTTPSIPDLIAALEEHDRAMTANPWVGYDDTKYTTWYVDRAGLRVEEREQIVEINSYKASFDAAAIAWFGTHRGALAEALKAGLAALDDMTPLIEPHNDGSVDKCPTYYDGCHCSVATLTHNIARAERAEAKCDEIHADRVRLADELRPLRDEVKFLREQVITLQGDRCDVCDEDGLIYVDDEDMGVEQAQTCPACDGTRSGTTTRVIKERDDAKREAESLRALLGDTRGALATIHDNEYVDGLIARIDLARGKDGTR